MFDNKKKWRGVAPEERDLEFEVEIKVIRKAEYRETSEITKVKIEKTLQMTTDARIKDIKSEVKDLVSDALDAVKDDIEQSKYLTDGYHAEVAKDNQTEDKN